MRLAGREIGLRALQIGDVVVDREQPVLGQRDEAAAHAERTAVAMALLDLALPAARLRDRHIDGVASIGGVGRQKLRLDAADRLAARPAIEGLGAARPMRDRAASG